MKCSELLRILKKDGWYPISQKGSHIKLIHDNKNKIILKASESFGAFFTL